jgi:hypothetical protein
MRIRHIRDGLLIALALPAYQIWNIGKYANTRQGWFAKVATFVCFLPIIALCTMIWGFVWAMALSPVLRLVK